MRSIRLYVVSDLFSPYYSMWEQYNRLRTIQLLGILTLLTRCRRPGLGSADSTSSFHPIETSLLHREGCSIRRAQPVIAPRSRHSAFRFSFCEDA